MRSPSAIGMCPDRHVPLVVLAPFRLLAVGRMRFGLDTDAADPAAGHTLPHSAVALRHSWSVSSDCTDPNSLPAREVAVAADTGCPDSMTWLLLARDRCGRDRARRGRRQS